MVDTQKTESIDIMLLDKPGAWAPLGRTLPLCTVRELHGAGCPRRMGCLES